MATRWGKTDRPPEGLLYQADFIAPKEESALVAAAERTPFHEVRMHGVAAKRTTAHFGWTYAFESWKLTEGEPIPGWMLPLRERAAAAASVSPDEFAEALLTRYPAGAGIGWHRDAMAFGDPVVGISLLSGCPMKFRRETPGEKVVYVLELAPRSLYVMGGPARWQWQHSIPATRDLRYSITFRTLRRRPAG